PSPERGRRPHRSQARLAHRRGPRAGGLSRAGAAAPRAKARCVARRAEARVARGLDRRPVLSRRQHSASGIDHARARECHADEEPSRTLAAPSDLARRAPRRFAQGVNGSPPLGTTILSLHGRPAGGTPPIPIGLQDSLVATANAGYARPATTDVEM